MNEHAKNSQYFATAKLFRSSLSMLIGYAHVATAGKNEHNENESVLKEILFV